MGFSYLKGVRLRADLTRRVNLLAVILACFTVGCGGGGSEPSSSVEAEHIGKVGGLIEDFKSANEGNNPKNIDELKKWATQNGKAEDKDFISTRDNQPYVIEPMAMVRGGGPGGAMGKMAMIMPMILHEAKGKNGMIYVVQGSAPIGTEMSDEALKYLLKGPSTVPK
jgi:hypothetical protein